jgi:hypothetical protein
MADNGPIDRKEMAGKNLSILLHYDINHFIHRSTA